MIITLQFFDYFCPNMRKYWDMEVREENLNLADERHSLRNMIEFLKFNLIYFCKI